MYEENYYFVVKDFNYSIYFEKKSKYKNYRELKIIYFLNLINNKIII